MLGFMGMSAEKLKEWNARLLPRPAADNLVTKLSLDIVEVDELDPLRSAITGLVTHVESTNSAEAKKLNGCFVCIEANLPAQKVAALPAITLEAVSFENMKEEPMKGKLERLTLNRATLIVKSMESNYDGRTLIVAKIHDLDPRFNTLAALMTEGYDAQVFTHLPKDKIIVGAPMTMEKIELAYSGMPAMLHGYDPRPSGAVPGHPDYLKTLWDATKAVAMSTSVTDTKTSEATEEEKTQLVLDAAANTPPTP